MNCNFPNIRWFFFSWNHFHENFRDINFTEKKASVRCAVSAVRVTIFSSYDSNVMWNSNKTQSNLKPCSKHIKQILPINFCQIHTISVKTCWKSSCMSFWVYCFFIYSTNHVQLAIGKGVVEANQIEDELITVQVLAAEVPLAK